MANTNNNTQQNNTRDNTLHIFCIGGSGLRVFRSMLMLMASGYDIEKYKIQPYLVDPHLQSEELSEVTDLITKYKSIWEDTNEGFFRMPVIADLNNLNVMNSSRINNKSFGAFIKKSEYTPGSSEAMLIDMLYSVKNIETSMSVGFKGSPNVGCVVFQDFINSQWFSSFKPGNNDKILLIGSLFGGTGSSGIPAIAAGIKRKSRDIKVGVIALTSYYELSEPEENAEHKDISSQNFEPKSYAALSFYKENSGNFDRFYVFGDSLKKKIPYNEASQGNDAHFIELVASLAAKDFAEENDYVEGEKWNHFVINTNNNTLNFDDAGNGLIPAMYCLGNFYSFAKLFFLMQRESRYPFYKAYKDLLASPKFVALRDFLYNDQNDKYSFIQWMGQISNKNSQEGNNGRVFNAIDTSDIVPPDADHQIRHYRFDFNDNFRLFNKNENRFSGDTIITRQLLKMNVAYRSGLNNKQQHDAISDFLNAAFRGIQAVNLELNLFTLNE